MENSSSETDWLPARDFVNVDLEFGMLLAVEEVAVEEVTAEENAAKEDAGRAPFRDRRGRISSPCTARMTWENVSPSMRPERALIQDTVTGPEEEDGEGRRIFATSQDVWMCSLSFGYCSRIASM